ncbi:hypothetical protein COV49_03620 [Candidatus Falkowbacteria bacterium CG11_big_fil_rev_8_21_14_0_20_39_10]|uniref:Uncharacterized protein n=1 Tax=Candidatus Falkowbacteria bacterium CG11_big_fil_rev_8_21_14_0_20_39_10 TaxID=1974570 RepID=A0A2M6K8I0_9BACT|nr:MAG: hypothetical protein COV49_03620 [Candidatus Falkowbacteria bacterium CG11_big_fil_rev_8_21_14_0_20_39_10]
MKKGDKNNKPITKGEAKKVVSEVLGQFTEDVLLPSIEKIVNNQVDEKIGQHRHEMKNYIDEKLTSTKGDIISYIKGDRERDKNWKLKIVNILKREKLAKSSELKFLVDLVR